MQEIQLCRLEKFIEYGSLGEAYIVVGKPCEKLFKLQESGYCVMAELKWLKGLSDEEIAEAICKEDAVLQYTNVCIDVTQLSQAYLRRIWCRHKHMPVLIGETKHLLIRESVREDAEAFWELYQDEACRKYLEPLPVEEESVEAYGRYIDQYQTGQYAFFEYGMWSVVEKKSQRCIGRVGLEQVSTETDSAVKEGEAVISLGYAILPKFRGKGYAVEACKEVLKYCKECEYAKKVHVQIHKDNTASLRVYEKLLSDR